MSESQVGFYNFAGKKQIRSLIELYYTLYKDAEIEVAELFLCLH